MFLCHRDVLAAYLVAYFHYVFYMVKVRFWDVLLGTFDVLVFSDDLRGIKCSIHWGLCRGGGGVTLACWLDYTVSTEGTP